MTYKQLKKLIKSHGVPEVTARIAARAIASGEENAYTSNLSKWGVVLP